MIVKELIIVMEQCNTLKKVSDALYLLQRFQSNDLHYVDYYVSQASVIKKLHDYNIHKSAIIKILQLLAQSE